MQSSWQLKYLFPGVRKSPITLSYIIMNSSKKSNRMLLALKDSPLNSAFVV